MTDKQKKATYIVVILLVLAGAFAAGRYTLPAKVVTIEKQVEVEKVVTQTVTEWKERIVYVQKENRDVQTKTVTTKAPDGTETTTTETIDKTKIDTASSQEASSQAAQTQVIDETKYVDREKIVTNNKDWHLSVQAGAGARFLGELTPQLTFGATVERRIIGPFFMGFNVNAMASVKPGGAPPLGPPVTVTGSLVLGLEF